MRIPAHVGKPGIGHAECGNIMRHIIYKITNNINGKYYIGRHSTNNIDDGYLGSGIGIVNAIAKYGKENFTKEIIAEAFSRDALWEIEKEIVNIDVVEDPQSYNMAYGGKHYLHGLKHHDKKAFIQHQSNAGKIGGPKSYANKTVLEKKKWHSKGGSASVELQKQSGIHPFFTGEAAIMGGKAAKGMLELWHPDSIATNKNQKEYKIGDCVKALPNSEKYINLKQAGWLSATEQREKINAKKISKY